MLEDCDITQLGEPLEGNIIRTTWTPVSPAFLGVEGEELKGIRTAPELPPKHS